MNSEFLQLQPADQTVVAHTFLLEYEYSAKK
jgi:hypothetical protein